MVRIKLNESELQELAERLKRAKSQSTLVYLDLKIIELAHQGQSAPQIGKLLGLHANTVRTLIKKFQAHRFEGLTRKPRGKPEEKLKAYDKAYWQDILSQAPSSFEQLETPDQNWSYELIQQYIEHYLQIKVTVSTVWNHLRRVGFTSGRAKLSITSPDPDYQVKRQRVEALKKKAVNGILSQADSRFYVEQDGVGPKKAMLMMMDETDIHLCPDLKTKGLQVKGQQLKVEGPGLDEVCYLFGSTDPFTGEGLYEIYDQKASCQFCFHLEHLLQTFPDYFIFVVGDNAPAHRSAATTDFLKAHQDRLEFVPLPTYSPNLNGIERLWRVMRDKLMRSIPYDSLHQKCTTLMNFLRTLSFDRFIDILGVAKNVLT